MMNVFNEKKLTPPTNPAEETEQEGYTDRELGQPQVA